MKIEYQKSDRGRMREARTRGGVDVELRWLAVLVLDQNIASPCSLSESDRGLPLKEHGARAQTGHNYIVCMNRE